MILRLTAALSIAIAFFYGLVIQDAANPLMMLPVLILSTWLTISGRLSKIPLRDPVLLGFTVLWLLWTVSALFSEFPFNSKVTWIIMSTLPVSYMVWRTADFPEAWQRRILQFFLASGVALSIKAILDTTITPTPLWNGRAYIPFLDPNMLGIYLSMSLLPVVPLVLKKDLLPHHRLFLIASLALMLAGLIATQSRSAFIGTAAGLGLIGLLSWRHIPRTKSSLAAVSAAVVAGVAMLIHTNFLNRFLMLFETGGDKDVMARLSLWRTAFDMSLNKPLTGYGFGTFGLYYPAFREPQDNSAGWWVHMDPLQWAVECGWLAPLCFYALTAYIVVRIWKRARDLTPLHIGFAAALLSLFLNAHTAYPLHVIPFMIFATGMIAALLPSSPASSARTTYCFVVPMLLALLTMFWAGMKSGTTLYFWNEVNEARRTRSQALFEANMTACLEEGDPQFAYCKLLMIETILNSRDRPPETVLKAIEDSRAYNPLLPQPDYYLSIYHRKNNPDKPELEIGALKDSLIKNPTYWPARKALVEALQKAGRLPEAMDILETGTNYPMPKSALPYYTQTRAALRLNLSGEQ
jgi:O-antigen ligase